MAGAKPAPSREPQRRSMRLAARVNTPSTDPSEGLKSSPSASGSDDRTSSSVVSGLFDQKWSGFPPVDRSESAGSISTASENEDTAVSGKNAAPDAEWTSPDKNAALVSSVTRASGKPQEPPAGWSKHWSAANGVFPETHGTVSHEAAPPTHAPVRRAPGRSLWKLTQVAVLGAALFCPGPQKPLVLLLVVLLDLIIAATVAPSRASNATQGVIPRALFLRGSEGGRGARAGQPAFPPGHQTSGRDDPRPGVHVGSRVAGDEDRSTANRAAGGEVETGLRQLCVGF